MFLKEVLSNEFPNRGTEVFNRGYTSRSHEIFQEIGDGYSAQVNRQVTGSIFFQCPWGFPSLPIHGWPSFFGLSHGKTSQVGRFPWMKVQIWSNMGSLLEISRVLIRWKLSESILWYIRIIVSHYILLVIITITNPTPQYLTHPKWFQIISQFQQKNTVPGGCLVCNPPFIDDCTGTIYWMRLLDTSTLTTEICVFLRLLFPGVSCNGWLALVVGQM